MGYAFPQYSDNLYEDNVIQAIGVTGSIASEASRAETWEKEDYPYYLDGTVTIGSKVTLTIEAGVVVKSSGSGIGVHGILDVQGTASQNVVFTSLKDDSDGNDTNGDSDASIPREGDSGGISIYNSENILDHCTIRYGSGSWHDGTRWISGAVYIHQSSPTIDQCTITNSGYAVVAYGPSQPIVTNSNIFENSDGIDSRNDASVSATNVWWGDATGPVHSTNSEGRGDSVSDNVTFDPWLTAPFVPDISGPPTSGGSGGLGDVSMNGVIRPYDASLILQHTVGRISLTTDQLSVADVNGDNATNESDATDILRFSVGLLSSFSGASKVVVGAAPVLEIREPERLEDGTLSVSFELTAQELASGYVGLRYDSLYLLSLSTEGLPPETILASHQEDGHLRFAFSTPTSSTRNVTITLVFDPTRQNQESLVELDRVRINGVTLDDLGHGIQLQRPLPEQFALYQNYPNPFNPQTTISYDLPEDVHVSVVIYDMIGQVVRDLVESSQEAGEYQITWNATDNAGESVASGLYFAKVIAGDHTATRKMLLLR